MLVFMNSLYTFFKNNSNLKEFDVINSYDFTKFNKKNCLQIPPILPTSNFQEIEIYLRIKPDYDFCNYDKLINAFDFLIYNNSEFLDKKRNKIITINFNCNKDFIFYQFDDFNNAIFKTIANVKIVEEDNLKK